MASDRRDRQADPVYVDLILWPGQAEAAAEHLVKGQAVSFSGRFEPRSYTTRDGRDGVAYEVHDVALEYGAKPRGDDPAPAPPSDTPEAAADGVDTRSRATRRGRALQRGRAAERTATLAADTGTPRSRMRITRGLLVVLVTVAVALAPATSTAEAPVARTAATCADYPNQAAAQRAADTRDADGDGIYCEDLPCPCSTEAGADGGDKEPDAEEGCTKPDGVQRLVFSASKYKNIRRHFQGAVRRGWPRRLVLNRAGADARRDRLLAHYPPREDYDRDEYPPAVGRGKGKGLERGRNPRGWRADVRYVPSSENRSHGASLGAQLRDFCNGTRFRYVFR